MYGESWSVHPDFWVCRPEVDYKVAYARARRLGAMLAALATSAVASEGLRLAVELYGPSSAVLADGSAIAWIGPDPDDAVLWALLGPDEPLPLDLSWVPAAA